MPHNLVETDAEVEKIEEGNAGNKEYKRQCDRILGHFNKFKCETENDDRSIEDIIKASEVEFEGLVKKFMIGLRVDELEVDKMTGKKSKTGKQVYPTIGYMRNIKSTLFGCFNKKYKVGIFYKGGININDILID